VQSGENAGYPRFKGQGRYDSFTYPQSGFRIERFGKLSRGERVFLSKVGHVKAAIHRQPEGVVKTATVRRSSSDKWYICFSCEVNPKPLPECREAVGIDVGLDSFATTSEGEKVTNPRFFRGEEKALRRAQRKLSRSTDTQERERRRKVVARVHERVVNRRRDFEHKTSRRLVNCYGFIAVENLPVDRMSRNHCLAKSIRDVAWSEFVRQLVFKAEWAGRQVVKINPAYTSQDCSRCGRRRYMQLSERIYRCDECGLVLDRNHNAARNILSLGLQTQTKGQDAVAWKATE
jgi:putative transposase